MKLESKIPYCAITQKCSRSIINFTIAAEMVAVLVKELEIEFGADVSVDTLGNEVSINYPEELEPQMDTYLKEVGIV